MAKDRERDLTPDQRIRCAFMHYCNGIKQEHLAMTFGVNGGRVNEACLAIMKAAENPKLVRRYKEKIKGLSIHARKIKRGKL